MNNKNQSIKVGISVGDLNGIGIELILKTLQDKNILDFFTPIIFGSTKVINHHAQHLQFEKLNLNGINEVKQSIPKKINVVNIWKEPYEVEFGKETLEAGKRAVSSFQTATQALKEGKIDVLVTAPFNKNTVQSEEYKHAGHTEYLGEVFKKNALMILCAEDLRVALITQHIPIEKVAETITQSLIIEKVKTFEESLKKDFYITKPKIAILGLNPHSGDNGLIGTEEQKIIIPAIEKLKKEKILAFGPYAADSYFIPGVYDKFDGVMCMYHDQGLIPFKSMHFDDGVNFSSGLDKIRTSPDHGVAYDIAGKGIANETSFKEAIFTAIKIFNNRLLVEEDTKNPLSKKANYKGKDEDLPNEK